MGINGAGEPVAQSGAWSFRRFFGSSDFNPVGRAMGPKLDRGIWCAGKGWSRENEQHAACERPHVLAAGEGQLPGFLLCGAKRIGGPSLQTFMG